MMMYIKLPGVLFVCAIITETVGYEYCDSHLCSTPKDHTMCKYPADSIACAGNAVGLTQYLRQVILERHNMYRQTVARGEQSPQPPASNMMKLRWHDEAARIAQRWANQCVNGHDSCRSLANLESVGQNIASHKLSRTPDIEGEIMRMIDSWYAEVENFDADHVDGIGSADNIQDYVPLIWAETTAIGCGLVIKAPSNSERVASLVCNYVPGGNYLHKPMYKRGRACSECPGTTKCSKRYPGLCTHEDDESDPSRDPKRRKEPPAPGKDYGDRSGRDCSDPEDMSYRRRAGGTVLSTKPSVFLLLCLLLCVYRFHDVHAQ